MTHRTVDEERLDAILQPRADIVLERPVPGTARFEQDEGPFRRYARRVEVEQAGGGLSRVVQTVEYALALPYFGWLLALPVRRTLARPARATQPWWAPPARLDARASTMLGTLCLVSAMFGYLNTVFNQTVAFASEELGADNGAQGTAGAVVRLGGLIALALVVVADRRGRRGVLLWSALAGCLLAAVGALAPSLAWLTVSQTLARGFTTALVIVVAILAVEEMPAGSRAYALSVLAMASGLGAGVCLWALPLADLGNRGWRLLYVLPLAAIPLLWSIGRHLPESRRFTTAPTHPGGKDSVRQHRRRVGNRLLLLAASGALLNLFVAPQAQFHNQFLRAERGFSGSGIALLSLTVGTAAGVGVVAGGRLADLRGRRVVAVVALLGGAFCTATFYFAHGVGLWLWALTGAVVFDAAIPALGVYGPELFPTSLRGRANGAVAVTSLAGSAAGLLLAGQLADHFGEIGPAMAVLSVGPALVAVLVVVFYPETAGRELEDINPEDRAPP